MALTTRDAIDVLLAEYNTLRTEIQSRTRYIIECAGIGGPLIVWSLTKLFDTLWSGSSKSVGVTTLILVILATASVAVGWIFFFMIRINNGEIHKCAQRIVEIEHEVNHYAGTILLRWETYWGASVTGWWKSNPHKPYPPGLTPKSFADGPSGPEQSPPPLDYGSSGNST